MEVTSPFLQLAIALAVIIVAAKLGGYISLRLGQPSVLGELLVGILLGPSVLNLLHLPYFQDEHLGEVVKELAEVGVLLLMFIAGLDLHLPDLAKAGKVSALAGVLGVIFPLFMGAGLMIALFDMTLKPAIFIGLILAATSVSISAQTLMELKVLRSRVGIGLLGAAVFDDILVVLGLSVFVALTQTGGGGLMDVVLVAGQMFLYLGVAALLGWYFLPRLSRRVSSLPISQGLIAFTFVIILLYGWTAEMVGHMAAITGAFLAGLMLSRSPVKERIESGISTLAYGVFVPIFFINVGLSANARLLTSQTVWLLVGMTLVAVAGKVLGAGLGARLAGMTNREALQMGVGMMSRGEVGLIVATVGIQNELITSSVFAVVVGVVILTTLMTPPLLRTLFPRNAAPGKNRVQQPVEGRPVKKRDQSTISE